jgi:2-aminobenzoate-CoA ligase
MLEPKGTSAHVDTFARDNLPPRELWPVMDFAVLPELRYAPQLSAATALLDDMVARGHADRPAIRFPGGGWTYAELLEQANRVARTLVDDCGLVPGNRVLLRGPNNAMLAACWFGVLKAGGICVATMPLLRARELAYIIDKAQIRLALCDARGSEELERARQAAPVLREIRYFGGGGEWLEAAMRKKPSDFRNVETAADDTAIIAFTSGTTGQAKGTMHFHRDLIVSCDLFPGYVLEPTPDDVCCGSPPLAFTFGLGGLLMFPLRIGASTLLLEQATPPHLIQAIQDHRPTICFTSPTAYRAMLGMLKDHDASSLVKCVSAGEHLPAATMEAWHRATGIKIIDGIGATEMQHIFISAAGGDIRPGSTGRAVPGYQAKVVSQDGEDVPPGTIGRLAVRGPTGCRYLADVERQRAYVQDGWNFPGDSFLQDPEGYFWYQARTDDMIISGGYNLSAVEVETVLLEHPQVQECGVVGVPDEARGQIVKAFVVLKPGVEAGAGTVKALQEFVKSQIAPYKYPRSVEFLPSLPRTETGKLQRFRLRQEE